MPRMPRFGVLNRRIGRAMPRSLLKAIHRSGRFFAPVGAAMTAAEGFGLARRVYRNAKNKRKWSSYKEVPATKRPKTVPSVPGSRVSAKYAVAPRMTKFRKATVTKQKVPKSAIVHYKEYGQFNAEKCMFINHEHWGNVDKLWKGIGYGLTKLLLPYAKIYNAKSMEDPCIGPRTNADDPAKQYDDKSVSSILRLIFCSEGVNGAITRSSIDIGLEDIAPSTDVYRSFDAIASDVTNALRNKYNFSVKTWLAEAQIFYNSNTDNANSLLNIQPIYIQNLDDAEINLYVHSLVKFQNVTPSDSPTTATAADKTAIDANPLVGRLYKAKGHYPQVDSDVLNAGDKTLDSFFGTMGTNGGLTLLGYANNHTADDLGRIAHIPQARELYGNQYVQAGHIHMAAGAMKYHKTTFTLKKTFRALAGIGFVDSAGGSGRRLGMHTLFGLTLQHKHGEDSIKVGYNRDTDVGCHIKHKRILYPLKTNYTLDADVVNTTVSPTDHQ